MVWLSIEPMGPPEAGIWCDQCLLPARIRQPVALTRGGEVLALGTFETCTSGCDDEPIVLEGRA